MRAAVEECVWHESPVHTCVIKLCTSTGGHCKTKTCHCIMWRPLNSLLLTLAIANHLTLFRSLRVTIWREGVEWWRNGNVWFFNAHCKWPLCSASVGPPPAVSALQHPITRTHSQLIMRQTVEWKCVRCPHAAPTRRYEWATELS